VLADLGGRPVLAWVHDVALAAGATSVVVAVDDARVEAVARARGFDVVLTGEHTSGTDRVAEVTRGRAADARIVNIQGDAPLLDPAVVVAVARALDDPRVDVATASVPLGADEQGDPNVVKTDGRRFSRRPLPGARRHLGVYGFRNRALQRWTAAPPADDEVRERLEQLRPLGLGMRFAVVEVANAGPDIDTPGDLEHARRIATDAAPAHRRPCTRTDTLASAHVPGAVE